MYICFYCRSCIFILFLCVVVSGCADQKAAQNTLIVSPIANIQQKPIAEQNIHIPQKFDPREPIGFVTEFHQKQIWIHDKAYGTKILQIAHHDFPRRRLPGLTILGTPIYKQDASYFEIALPSGKTGWIDKSVALTPARPCPPESVSSPSTPRGPVSSGSGSVSCY